MSVMEKYHMQKSEREITDESWQNHILDTHDVMTLAMCKQNQPYLVSMDYFFNQEKDEIYFHCATKGMKVEFLQDNPHVWGQVLVDQGYIQNECSHAYQTVQFKGTVSLISDPTDKRNILEQMIRKFEDSPESLIKRFLSGKNDLKLIIGKIALEKKWGKENSS